MTTYFLYMLATLGIIIALLGGPGGKSKKGPGNHPPGEPFWALFGSLGPSLAALFFSLVIRFYFAICTEQAGHLS